MEISIFSKDSQRFIREWGRKETLRNDAIEARFITDVEDKSRWDNNGSGIVRKTWKEGYGIELSNESQLDLKNIRTNTLFLNSKIP